MGKSEITMVREWLSAMLEAMKKGIDPRQDRKVQEILRGCVR